MGRVTEHANRWAGFIAVQMHPQTGVKLPCYIRLVAKGIIEGSKRPFFSHTVPFFGHIARLYSLKKPSYG
jgi:hypothetical protein